MRKLLCTVILLSVLFCACGCTDAAEPVIPEITDEDLYTVELPPHASPVIDGSAAWLPYYTAAASRVLGVTEAEAVRYVLCSSAEYAYPDLIEGRADVIFCPLPTADQVRLADHAGVTLACYPVLNEALVFYVSRSNPVDGLTLQQLRDIYAGRITNWQEVGGSDEPILAFQHAEGFPAQEALLSLVLTRPELMDPPLQEREGTMGELADTVASFDGSAGAIGYSYLYQLENQSSVSGVKLLKIDGIAPAEQTIVSGDYPLITQAFAVIRGGEEETPAGEFAQWCAWPLGQALAEDKGYVPVQIQTELQSPEEPEGNAETPSYDWAEGKPSLSGKTAWQTTLVRNEDGLFASGIAVEGLAESEIQDAINARIQQTVERFCDPAYVPDVQGIRAYETLGFDPASCSYKYVYTRVTAATQDFLSLVVSCDAYYTPKPDGQEPLSFNFTTCDTLNIDLRSGKDVPVTAFAPGSGDALSAFNKSVQAWLKENEDSAYSETAGPEEGAVRVTGFPGLAEEQVYYYDAAEKTLCLVLDARTPWSLSGPQYRILPLKDLR